MSRFIFSLIVLVHMPSYNKKNNILFFFSFYQMISLVLMSIGIYARMMKHAGK